MHDRILTKLRQLELLQSYRGKAANGQAPGEIPRHVSDPAFLLRGNPEHPEHDARGLRNRKTTGPTDLVVIGDSQVYGAGVRAEQCWPFRLQAGLGSGVYNAGMNGWGSVQYALAAEELLALAPRRMLVCLYTGSDLAEAFQCARASTAPLAKSFWTPEWAALPLADLSPKARAEAAISELLAAQPELLVEDALALLAQRGEPDVNPCVLEASRFYLTENYRFAAQDLEHPGVAAGLEITHLALAHLRDLSFNYGFTLGVILIPTREYLVYERMDEATLGDRAALERLGLAEASVLGELRATCAALSLRCFDLSGYLKHFIGGRIYPQNSRDGHPNAKGCELIARYVRERVLPGLEAKTTLRATVGGVYPMY